jgi:hypothetical protein
VIIGINEVLYKRMKEHLTTKGFLEEIWFEI